MSVSSWAITIVRPGASAAGKTAVSGSVVVSRSLEPVTTNPYLASSVFGLIQTIYELDSDNFWARIAAAIFFLLLFIDGLRLIGNWWVAIQVAAQVASTPPWYLLV